MTLTLAPPRSPSVSNRGLRRGRRARRESKIVNLAARRSGADSNCYVLLSCGRPFDRVRRAVLLQHPNARFRSSLAHLYVLFPASLLPRARARARSLTRSSRLFSSRRESPTDPHPPAALTPSASLLALQCRRYPFATLLPTVCVGSL